MQPKPPQVPRKPLFAVPEKKRRLSRRPVRQ